MSDRPSSPPAKQRPAQHWARVGEAGGYWGLVFLAQVNRWLGRGALALVLAPALIYFMVCRPVARRASRDFLRRHYRLWPDSWRRPPGWRAVFRHFMSFSGAVADKFDAWTRPPDPANFDVPDRATLDRLVADDRGQLIIGSHHGNLEFCRGFAERCRKKAINVLLYDQHAGNFVRYMQAHYPDSRLRVLQVDALDIGLMLQLKAAVERGEWVFIAGDRVPVTAGGRTVDVTFMGDSAPLPVGPYVLANTLKCPVRLMFVYRLGNRLRVEAVEFSERVELPRAGRDAELAALAQRFASELEQRVRVAPLQWFNFYPFWRGDK